MPTARNDPPPASAAARYLVIPPFFCRFASRCPYAEAKCHESLPAMEEVLPGHFCACHRVQEINDLP